MRPMRDLLDRCADMRLQCLTGDAIMANSFTMASACTLIRTLVEEFEKTSIQLPIDDDHSIRVAVEVIHGIRSLREAPYEDVDACYRGFDYLGCTILRKKLQTRLWHFVSRSTDVDFVFKNAHRLVISGEPMGSHMNDYLNAVKTLCPTWHEFQRVFEHCTLNEPVAIQMMWRLCKYFPVHLVFGAIVDAFPPALLTYEICLNVLGSNRNGVYYHPDEVAMVMNIILERFSGQHTDHLRTFSDALCLYEASPGTNLTATTLTYNTEPRASVLIKLYEPYSGTKTLRVKRFVTATINTVDGTVHGRIDVDKLDDTNYYPNSILVRIMTFNTLEPNEYDVIEHKYTVCEAWREFTQISPTLMLHDPDVDVPEDERAIETAVKDVSTLRYIRLDFFFGHGDVRKLHLF